MTVTLISFNTADLGNGYVKYTATYKEENNTADAIDQATLNIYFNNSDRMTQYGFFGKILPGVSYATVRSYSFDVLKSSVPSLLEYDADHFFAATPVAGALQWAFPIK